jgi:hypothetical protein
MSCPTPGPIPQSERSHLVFKTKVVVNWSMIENQAQANNYKLSFVNLPHTFIDKRLPPKYEMYLVTDHSLY